jgi:hypothetical protein
MFGRVSLGEDNVDRQNSKIVEEQVQFRVQPIMVDHETSIPDLEPIFANHLEIQRMNTDIFIDVGVIRVPDMSSAIEEATNDPSKIPEVKFYVLQRIALSPATFAMFFQKMKFLFDQISQEVANASSSKANTTK